MAHLVKCAVCGEQFDRDKIQAVKYSARRYAHYKCKPDGELVPLAEQKDPDLIKLEEYIKQLLNDTYVHPRVKKQINEYHTLTLLIRNLFKLERLTPLIEKQIKDLYEKNNYSYMGIVKSLIYFYEVKGNKKDKLEQFGIAIVPYVYKDAYNYYYDLFLAQSRNQTKDIATFTSKIKEITIKAPEIKIQKKFFNLDDEKEVENE